MPIVFRTSRAVVALAAATLAACSLDSANTAEGPAAALKVIHLMQGVDNAQIGFDRARALATVTFSSVAPVEDASYLFVDANGPRQLRLLSTTVTIIDTTVALLPNSYYTILTTGTPGASGAAAPAVVILENNMTQVPGGNLRFRFVHGAVATGRVDVHISTDTGSFDAATRIADGVPFRGSASIEADVAGTRTVCVIGAGVLPTPTGTNCSALRSYGVPPGAVLTAALRDPIAPETSPGILYTLDRTP